MASLLEFTKEGIYCREADVYIDPWKPVRKALITHAHSDHARSGMSQYLCHRYTAPILRHRLGSNLNIQTIEYGEKVYINGVTFSFHPAGHVVGSAQIRVEHRGEVWVVSGDYKVMDDEFTTPFESVKCHTFITECTFGLPIFRWQPQSEVLKSITSWWEGNQQENKVGVLCAYSLGKAQRITQALPDLGKVYVHGAVHAINTIVQDEYRSFNKPFYPVTNNLKPEDFKGSIVVTPSSAAFSNWTKRFGNVSIAGCSGWMQMRGSRRRQNYDRGFVMSDHADWPGLLHAIQQSGAERVITTHGYTDTFTEYLNELGIQSVTEKTSFETEDAERE
jgi:putative mRNA 3-end processing factor